MAFVLKQHRSPDSADVSDVARNVSGLAGFNLDDLATQGRLRLDQCREQIRHMLDEANQQAQAVRSQAKQDGYRDGLAEAAKDSQKKVRQEAEKLAGDSLETIHRAVHALHQTYQDWMQQYADSLTTISIEAAEKIVRRKLEKDATVLVDWVREAVHSTRSASQLTVAVHPETLAALGQSLDELLASPELPEKTVVEPDQSVGIDEVVIRQPGGTIRIGLKQQLARLEELLS